jgi:hypothetical protein
MRRNIRPDCSRGRAPGTAGTRRYYFVLLAVATSALLLAAAGTGMVVSRPELHVATGLLAAILTVGTHTLVILFMIVTGRVLREAIRSRPLSREFLAELNEFFARSRGYPIAVFGAFSIVVTAVLGYAARGFGLSPLVHPAAGILALGFNLWALSIEWRVLLENMRLIDRAAADLDRIDREDGSWAERARAEERAERPPGTASRRWLVIGLAAWLPYLYWGLISWRGDFSRVSLHPWLEISVVALVIAWLTRGYAPPEDGPGETQA